MSRPSSTHVLADSRHAAEAAQQVAANRLEALALDVDAETLGQLVDVHLGAEHPGVVGLLDDRLGLDVVLVANLANQFLDEVLDRDEARRAAVLVHHQGGLRTRALQFLEQLRRPLGGRARRAPAGPAP